MVHYDNFKIDTFLFFNRFVKNGKKITFFTNISQINKQRP
jgi:hypothetical protein